jgi:acetoin utilization deacetylase AcuC-like enzyme
VAGAPAAFGAWAFDTSCPILAGTWEASLLASQAALTAAELVRTRGGHAYALVRPPGHHAGPDFHGGFCYTNHAAIAARHLQRQDGCRVALLDIDYHHGNGTQEIFAADPNVFFCSIHVDPGVDYPFFWGFADEVGDGPGRGTNRNIPLPHGTDDAAYLAAVDAALEAIAAVPGSIVVVSLGFDTYALDPIGDFALTTPAYHEIGGRVAALGRPLVVLQEGGYHRPSLGDNARAWLRGADGRPYDPTPVAGIEDERRTISGR